MPLSAKEQLMEALALEHALNCDCQCNLPLDIVLADIDFQDSVAIDVDNESLLTDDELLAQYMADALYDQENPTDWKEEDCTGKDDCACMKHRLIHVGIKAGLKPLDAVVQAERAVHGDYIT